MKKEEILTFLLLFRSSSCNPNPNPRLLSLSIPERRVTNLLKNKNPNPNPNPNTSLFMVEEIKVVEEGEARAKLPISPPPPPPPPPIISHGKRIPTSPTSLPLTKKTRDLPDLSICHCCGLRPEKNRVRALNSLWRILLLCKDCLSKIRSAKLCSYCLESDPTASSARCLRCSRRVHLRCVPREQRYLLPSQIDPNSFTCIDCCPIPNFLAKNNSLEELVREASSAAEKKAELAATARENAMKKAVVARSATERARGALGAVVVGEEGALSTERGQEVDPVVADEELALQLHLAMNGSQRISRSLGSPGPGDHKKARKVCEKVEICVENKSSFDTVEESDFGKDPYSHSCSSGKKDELRKEMGRPPMVMPPPKVERRRRLQFNSEKFGDPNGIVLALECVGHVRQRASKLDKQSSPPDRYLKKYSKRNPTVKGMVDTNDNMPCPV
ncbi:uncharacterized protein [Typha latifolia]|uniref:uncharacterized protein n=1 Tax=Typha latifolia TaxID=4733 RepID=UPI003C2CE571